jgi:hypothetical protein
LPKPQLILVRYLVALSQPREVRWPAAVLLTCLQRLAPLLHPAAGAVCAEHAPALIEFLQGMQPF